MNFSLRIVLVEPRNPLNIGAAARAMANFGFDDLVVVAPYDQAWRQARSARAGAAVLARARSVAQLAEAIADCECIIGTTAGAGRAPEVPLRSWTEIAATLPPRPCALLFGSEKTGLRVADISYCRYLARLPTDPAAPSLNLGQAVALCCYELRRQPPVSPPAEVSSASLADRERLVAQWLSVLEAVDVFRPLIRASQTRRLRAMLVRWQLSPADARLLLGLARQLRRVLGLAADETT